MAVPKKKTSKSKSRSRKAHDALTKPTIVYCQCGEPTRPRTACAKCGTYKGRQVLFAADDK